MDTQSREGKEIRRMRAALLRLSEGHHSIYADGKATHEHAGPPDFLICVSCLAREALGLDQVPGARSYFDANRPDKLIEVARFDQCSYTGEYGRCALKAGHIGIHRRVE